MNTEQIKEVVETIKTLNINFNDATIQKIADAIIPVVNKFIWLRVFEDILTFIGFFGVIALISILMYKASKTKLNQTNE